MATAGLARAGAAVLAVLYASLTVVVLVERDPRVTSYFTASPTLLAMGVAAGTGMIVVGAVVAVTSDRGSLGPLAMLVGVVWLAPVWAGWESAPPLVRSLAVVATPLIAPLLFHIALTPPRGGAIAGFHRHLVVAAYAVVATASVVRALAYEPIRDPDCWVSCGADANVFLVGHEPVLVSTLDALLAALAILLAVVAGATLVGRLGRPGRPRLPAAVVSGPAVLALVGEAGDAVRLLRDPLEQFQGELGAALFAARSAAVLALAAGTGWAATSRFRARRRVAALAHEIGAAPAPGDLEATLARSLRDDSLAVRYWLPQSERFVDASGEPAPLDPDDVRATALVVRGRERVAVVLHDADRVAGATLQDEIGSASRLAIDNERLRAERLAQLAELRESRTRIVEAADSHRARLERDLHDGAQQSLLAATYELRLARADAEAAGDLGLTRRLDTAIVAASVTLNDLRDFAHGVFPAVLDESGLAEAVWSLTDTALVPIEVEIEVDARPPAAAERAAYLLARAAIASADPRSGGPRIRIESDGLTLTVQVDGTGRVDEVHLADRVGAVDGTLHVAPGMLRAVIPCAS